MDKIIYTAIFGDYDELKEPAVVSPGVRYICFTDKHLNSKTWELFLVKPKYEPVRQAREVKICFHKYFPFFKGKAMWIDANQEQNMDVSYLFEISNYPLLLLRHPDRDCIYQEAQECLRLHKDFPEIVWVQMARYRKIGYPRFNGLVATGLMIRENNEAINKFCELWFEEIVKGSRRDQLSFNFVLWKHEIPYDTIPFSTLKENFIRCPHKNK